MSRAAAAIALTCAIAGCGLDVQSADLFQITRIGLGKPLTLIVNDSGMIRCNGGPAKPISDPMLLAARSLVTNLDKDAKQKLRLPAASGSVFSYTMRFQDGTISFADTSAARHPELAPAELFALQAARGPCGLGG